jgi:inward rectifier potassium channel
MVGHVMANAKVRRKRSTLEPIGGILVPTALARQIRAEFARRRQRDYYHRVLRLSWPAFGALILSCYLLLNVGFALAYLWVGGISGVRPGNFLDLFFFSLQTFVTLNFGTMVPKTFGADVVIAVETVAGLLTFAVTTSLIFARFSRPTARVLFSRCATVAPYNGIPTLMFRAANQRGNQILQAQVRVTLVRAERSSEGVEMRRIYDLPLTREFNSVFALTWTMMHPIDERSPLWGHTHESLVATETLIVVLVAGIDDTFNETIHARYLYGAQDIRWDHRFVDVFKVHDDGSRFTDYGLFHDTESCAAAAQDGAPRVANSL